MNRQLLENFLNNELRQKAAERGLQSLPDQAQVRQPDIAKVKLKQNVPERTPSR